MSSSTTAIIIAAGDGERWNDHRGVPKHFVPVDGEPIIERTVRLLRPHVSTIWVVGRDERYAIDGAQLFVPELDPSNFGLDKFLSSRDLWNRDGRTIVFYGDVFFTERAIGSIAAFDGQRWAVFGRFDGSWRTGKRYGELFAQSFWSQHIDQHHEVLQRLAEQSHRLDTRATGWTHYRLMNGAAVDEIHEHRRYENFVEIDDWTDDFDFPDDYEEFIRRRQSPGYLTRCWVSEAPKSWRRRLARRYPQLGKVRRTVTRTLTPSRAA